MADFAGNEMFESPNITPAAIGSWTEAEFLRAITEGVRPDGTQRNILVDKKVQWSKAKNIWQNAAIRTGLYMPIYLIKRLARKA